MFRFEDDPFDIAAAHFARVDSGRATQEEQRLFALWCEQSPDNAAAWDAVCHGWQKAGQQDNESRLRDMTAAASARHSASRPARRRRLWMTAGVAAALITAISVPTLWWLNRPAATNNSQLAKSGEPLAAGLYIASNPGQRRNIRLPDGSRVALDVHSAIRVAFADSERSIWLEKGRAHFAVRKDKSRPFVVNAGRLRAIAVGTAFDVSRDDDGEDVTTSEGLVRVLTDVRAMDGGHATLVPAGMKLRQDLTAVHLAKADLDTDLAWQEGKIIFSSECLGYVAARMNRYGPQRLEIAEDARAIAISGVFDLNNAAALAQALEDQGSVRIVPASGKIMLARGTKAVMRRCGA